jgi:hypothetical protein
MPELSFRIDGVEPLNFAAAPTLGFKMRIENSPADQRIHSAMVRCQIQLEVTRRRYDAGEQERLFDLFGPPPDWGRTLRRMLWAQVTAGVPGFEGNTVVDLAVPCTNDMNVATTKYFQALSGGDVPLQFLFSGTVFYAGPNGMVQAAQIAWSKEAAFRMPIGTWQAMMDRFYPNSVCLCLPKDVAERLRRYKRESASLTWEHTVDSLLNNAEARVTS